MIFPVPESIFAPQVALVEQRFQLLRHNPAAFYALVEQGLAHNQVRAAKEKAALVPMRFFSFELFHAMLSGGEDYKIESLDFIWQRLLATRILVPTFTYIQGIFADHLFDWNALSQHLNDETFANLFWPPSSLATRYASSVLAVDVKKNGEDFRGSGFALMLDTPVIVTCRHNVDPSEGIEVKGLESASGAIIPAPSFAVHPTFDIAVALAPVGLANPYLRPGAPPKMFEPTFTLGYPNVPGSDSILVGHRGEVNGEAHLYLNQCPVLLFSNLVSPGSSGCPVLTEDGHCVGMTIQWLEADYGGASVRFSAAIPINEIETFARMMVST